ncbi:uncharacterized protein BJ171DRAFT_514652 [Polychytrium aggregatum]|uniref:uncharacterized protein n=1 Tax=Polychytrium aggregatum TaxID=110093 RepID=UPI0022FDEB61|nr:uncharacterized protein BJ171DRAFT_514652 [Polychytrium aggregatum]KAI9202283.1 hypothetical protein BJ171DRAFT_514652 [Polychytrium aggregatum]
MNTIVVAASIVGGSILLVGLIVVCFRNNRKPAQAYQADIVTPAEVDRIVVDAPQHEANLARDSEKRQAAFRHSDIPSSAQGTSRVGTSDRSAPGKTASSTSFPAPVASGAITTSQPHPIDAPPPYAAVPSSPATSTLTVGRSPSLTSAATPTPRPQSLIYLPRLDFREVICTRPAEQPDELSIVMHQRLVVLQELPDQWGLAECETGQRGYVPLNHLKKF